MAGEGRYEIQGDGSVLFTPAADFAGLTTPVRYRIEDDNGTTDTAQLQVTVRPGPVAVPDEESTLQNVTVEHIDVLGNDTPGLDAAGDPGTFDETTVVLTGAAVVPGVGTWTVAPDGTISFDPEPAFTGDAVVEYTVTDEFGNETTAVLTVTVTPIAPVANDDAAATPFATPVSLDGATDDVAGALSAPLVPSVTVFTANDLGTLTVAGEGRFEAQPDGSVLFTPAADFVGATTPVRYRIEDDNGTTDTALLTVTVRQGPAASADGTTTPQNVTIAGIDVLGNDTPGLDAAGDPGRFDETTVVLTGAAVVPGVGTWTVAPDGTISFDPEPSFTGDAVVEYTVTDEFGNETTAVLTVTVTPMVPVAADDAGVTQYMTPIELDVLGNDWSDARAPLLRETQRPLDPATGVQVEPCGRARRGRADRGRRPAPVRADRRVQRTRNPPRLHRRGRQRHPGRRDRPRDGRPAARVRARGRRAGSGPGHGPAERERRWHHDYPRQQRRRRVPPGHGRSVLAAAGPRVRGGARRWRPGAAQPPGGLTEQRLRAVSRKVGGGFLKIPPSRS